MIISLRTRLLIGIVLATAILMSLFSVVVYSVTHRSMIQHFDTSLLSTARMLSAVIEKEGRDDEHEEREHRREHGEHGYRNTREDSGDEFEGEIDFEFDVRMTPQFNNPNGGAYYQVWDAWGECLLKSPSLGRQSLGRLTGDSSEPQFRVIQLPDNKRGRAVSYQFSPRLENDSEHEVVVQNSKLTLVLARRADELYGHLEFLKWLLVCASVGIVFLSAVAAMVVTRTGLRPVHTLAGAINSVGEDNLGLDFPTAQYPAELAPICQCLNDVFCRLEQAFKREKQFNANVAHELRTPLAGMQSVIEVCLTRQRQPDQYREAFAECLQIVRAMHKMIDTLLTLSKLDAGHVSTQIEALSLDDLVDHAWRFHADRAYDKKITFDNSIPAGTVCRSDKDRLEMILSNLLENTVEYTNEGGRIWTDLEQCDEGLMLSISNTGCVLTEEDAEHVFDFFWRKSSSRTDTENHSGIGLSVARKIAQILGITIEIDIQDDIFCCRLTIPA